MGYCHARFAGGDAEVWMFSTQTDTWRVECNDCGAQVSSSRAPEEAEGIWNRRATVQQPTMPEPIKMRPDEIAALKEIFEWAESGHDSLAYGEPQPDEFEIVRNLIKALRGIP